MSKNTTNQTSRTETEFKNKLGYVDPKVAGIDIGDKLIHVAIHDGKKGSYVLEFGTTTPQLHKIVKTLKGAKVEIAVMEATGVYWVALYDILEDSGLQPVLVDAKNIKNPPGRKTDVTDAQWIQTVYSCGLVRAAFRPPRNRLKLRAYVRQRQNVVKVKQQAILHMEKSLQLMNIKLGTALSDITGTSGLKIIRAIVAGERNPGNLAALRSRLCKKKDDIFIASLTGNFQEEHIFALKQALAQYDFADQQLQECDMLIQQDLEQLPDVAKTPLPQNDKDKKKHPKFSRLKKPKKNAFEFDVRGTLWKKTGIDLTSLPGISDNTALLIFAELGGTDVSAWASEKSFSSWLKLCPGNNISGGKRRKSKRQKPSVNYISQALRMSAVGAKRTDTFLGAHIRRLCGRTDNSKGVKAGAHKLATMVYQMCKSGWAYYEKGAEYNDKAHAERNLKALHKKAALLGYKLVLAAA